MCKKRNKYKNSNEEIETIVKKVNMGIVDLGYYSGELNNCLNQMQEKIGVIRNIPTETFNEYYKCKKIRLSWESHVEEIKKEPQINMIVDVEAAAIGVGVGMTIATMGPTAAMGIATSFGVASTGTAISTLSGVAATNAALAWLGGGALAVGGGGMAAGNTLLLLAGPVGWGIAATVLVTTGIMFIFNRKNKKRLNNIFTLICERDKFSLNLAAKELFERRNHIIDERDKIINATKKIQSFGLNYDSMTESQQYELGAYVNLMNSSSKLLVNPILGLQPKFTEADIKNKKIADNKKNCIISLANMFYNIELNQKDKKLIWKKFRKNKQFLKQFNITKKELDKKMMRIVYDMLNTNSRTIKQ